MPARCCLTLIARVISPHAVQVHVDAHLIAAMRLVAVWKEELLAIINVIQSGTKWNFARIL